SRPAADPPSAAGFGDRSGSPQLLARFVNPYGLRRLWTSRCRGEGVEEYGEPTSSLGQRVFGAGRTGVDDVAFEDAGVGQFIESGGEGGRRDGPEHLPELVEAGSARPGGVDDRECVPPPEEVGRAADLLGERLAAAAAHGSL